MQKKWTTWLNLFTVTLLGLPLTTPLWSATAVTCTHDGHLHYHRVAAMKYAWQNGLYFTRWLPDLAFGYGYPFFIYREPTPLYAVLLPHLLGIPLPLATNLFYIACILFGGIFTFLWIRDLFGEQAGILSAVVYMATPYVLVDALIRGNSPESLALALFPFLLWAGRRWLLDGTAWWFLTAVFGLAFFALSHNISLLLFTPVLGLYLLLVGASQRLAWQPLILRLALLFGLGLGMTSFYTGGALLEINEVTLTQSTNTRNNDFRYNFASLDEIFSPVPAEDSNLLNPPLPFRLGWMPALLGFIGLIASFWLKEQEQRWLAWFMGGMALLFLLLALPVTRWAWETIPLIDFVQFPWRMVGRVGLPLAFLAGAGFSVLHPLASRYVNIGVLLAIALLIVEAFPLLYPVMCKEQAFPTVQTVHEYEQITGLVGVDPEGSYFPKTVRRRPRESVLLDDYANGRFPQRLDTTSLPAGATIEQAIYENNRASFQLTSPEPFTLQYLTFYFPGWQATLNGDAVPITPSNPEGLITIPVPAGSHEISIRWGSTPLRTALTSVSLLLFLATFVVAGYLYLSPFTMKEAHSTKITTNEMIPLALVAVFLLGGKFIVDRLETPLRGAGVPVVEQTAVLHANTLQLAGFNLSQQTLPADQPLVVDMAWQANDTPHTNYQSNLWLEDENGLIWSDKETHRPRIYESVVPTSQWQAGQWAWDSREIDLLSGIPAGEYKLILTMFELETLAPITLLDDKGQAIGPTAVLTTITVTEPNAPPTFAPQYPLTAQIESITLLGYNQDRDILQSGESLLLSLFTDSTKAQSWELTLTNEQGDSVQTWQLPITSGRVRQQYSLLVSGSLNSGLYQFMLAEQPLGVVQIEAPERLFAVEQMETAVHATFATPTNPIATLTSLSLAEYPQLTLIWQANSEINTRYRVFIHAVDGSGQMMAQADGEPVQWTRPTTGWAVDEYIIDRHQLPPEAESATALHIGLYDPLTGQRLTTEEADFVRIPLP